MYFAQSSISSQFGTAQLGSARSWSAQWRAESGEHTLTVRATDEAGNVQPSDQPWNYQGMGNNMTHRVETVVV